MRRFMRDLNSAYNMRPLKRDFGTCIEYARQEHQDKESNMLESNMQYWRKKFSSQAEVLPLLPLSNNTMRPDSRHVSSSHAECMIDEETVKATKQVCQELGITPFQFHLAVVQVLLAQSPGRPDICIGVADASRPDTKYRETIGFFLNLLPVRF
ncbi:Hybrid PKS-NRPS synthetase apdA [Metarhizium brunneum]|uniref:Hybrid PKS-NRPS synthetase apdA n=1 Tax=Metarhizium brunneum TaxID=500148 RepID=A0A7D5ZA12_9HYPO|nr:Hybrid PKS-NRPS synthetase apdA [Metarhizium brunneum]